MHSVDEHKNQSTDRRERAIGTALLVLGVLVAGGVIVKSGTTLKKYVGSIAVGIAQRDVK